MRYQSDNRIFQVDQGADFFYYIAPTAAAALQVHATTPGAKSKKSTKAVELPADKLIAVSFSDCVEALSAMIGISTSDPDNHLREILKAFPLAAEFVSVKRAAEQWARSIDDGQAKLLSSSLPLE